MISLGSQAESVHSCMQLQSFLWTEHSYTTLAHKAMLKLDQTRHIIYDASSVWHSGPYSVIRLLSPAVRHPMSTTSPAFV